MEMKSTILTEQSTKMISIYFINKVGGFTLIFSLLIALVAIRSSRTNDADVSRSIENVSSRCNSKLENFKSLSEYIKFVEDLKLLDKSGKEETDFKGDKKVAKCFQDKEALYELSNVITNFDRKRSCKFTEISKLEQYAKKYLSGKNGSKSVANKFFSLFGVNLSFYCQLNLLAHIKQADLEVEQLDFIYSMASPSGWNVLINEHTKKSMKFGVSSKSNNVVNRVAKLVPGLTSVSQLSYMDFHHQLSSMKDFLPIEKGSSKLSSAELASKVNSALMQIIESCQNLDQFYVNLILSLAKLNQIGLLGNFEVLTQYQENNITLHKWLAASSFCQLMTRVKSNLVGDSIEFEIKHDDKLLESRRKLYSYVDELPDEINPRASALAWTVSVQEADWNHERAALFRIDLKDGKVSVAHEQLSQFIRGLEADYKSSST